MVVGRGGQLGVGGYGAQKMRRREEKKQRRQQFATRGVVKRAGRTFESRDESRL